MSKFIDYLGPDSLEMKDESGNTLFHYAVGCLDELSIQKMIEKGANLVRNQIEEFSLCCCVHDN